MKRIPVACVTPWCDGPPPPLRPAGELAVGVVRWRGPAHRLTVVVKAALSFAGAAGPVVPTLLEAPPLALDRKSRHPSAGEGELDHASDFVPQRPGADLLLTGHARTPEPSAQIACSVRVGAFERRFTAMVSRPVS